MNYKKAMRRGLFEKVRGVHIFLQLFFRRIKAAKTAKNKRPNVAFGRLHFCKYYLRSGVCHTQSFTSGMSSPTSAM